MKLLDLTTGLVLRAVDIYLAVAWPGREAEKRPDLPDDLPPREILGTFADESKRDSHRYVLRLGNFRYPHMKFVFEEYLIQGEYFFSVDTHDEMNLDPEDPDYAAWLELKRHNRRVKTEIESGWRRAHVPTYETLRRLVVGAETVPEEPGTRGLVLVVDDERDIADAVASVLISEGYEVVVAHDGDEAVRTAERERPDLILMDYQMPTRNGIQAAREIRALGGKRPRILLATASIIDLSTVSEADGFLLKPYSRDILVSFIRALMKGS